jgi:hypothetical protein
MPCLLPLPRELRETRLLLHLLGIVMVLLLLQLLGGGARLLRLQLVQVRRRAQTRGQDTRSRELITH